MLLEQKVLGYSEMHVHFPRIRLFNRIVGPVLLFLSGEGGFVLWTGAEFLCLSWWSHIFWTICLYFLTSSVCFM